MDEATTIYSPGQAAQQLGVTTQSLRRYAEDYGAVFEPVPIKQKQRVFDSLIVERLRAAQELQQQGVAPSMRAGLERVRDGDIEPEKLNTLATNPFEQQVLRHLEMLVESNRQLHERVAELERGRQLDSPVGSQQATSGPQAELERTNRYLLGELERRRLESEVQTTRRPWWRLWKRP